MACRTKNVVIPHCRNRPCTVTIALLTPGPDTVKTEERSGGNANVAMLLPAATTASTIHCCLPRRMITIRSRWRECEQNM